MKVCEITFQEIVAALLHHWKTLALIFLLFLTLGAGAGIVFSGRASAEGSGSAEEWQQVEFDSVIFDLKYYNNCYASLSERSNALYTYVDTVRLDTTISEEQYQQLMILCEDITKYQQEVLAEINEDFYQTDAFYIPAELRQDATEEYTRLLDSTQSQIVKAENAMTLLQAIGGLTSNNEEINATYSTLLNQAAQYGQLQLNLKKYETILDRLENNYAQVLADSQKMDSQLKQAAAELDKLGEECYQVVREIALENYLDIVTQTTAEELVVQIDHTNRPATKQEAFVAFILFFGLSGICVGGFAALYKEYILQKKDVH